MSLQCPVCMAAEEWDEPALNSHVNSHFDEGRSNSDTNGSRPFTGCRVDDDRHDVASVGKRERLHRDDIERSAKRTRSQLPIGSILAITDEECPICGISLADLPVVQTKGSHVNACLDQGANAQLDHEDPVAQVAPQRAKGRFRRETEVGHGGEKRLSRMKGDMWWSSVDSPVDALPKNYSPGVIPILHRVICKSFENGTTKEAVLCDPGAVHIKGSWMFDLGWGCGYRNFLMGLSAVLMAYPGYRIAFPSVGDNGEDLAPGVLPLQRWIEDGWRQGYDQDGRKQLKGKIVGSKKWVGTSDLYAVFTAKGIPCNLYDFPKATGIKRHSSSSTHLALMTWVKKYFNECGDNVIGSVSATGQQKSAFDMLKESNGSAATKMIRQTQKIPLILQHSGHSRTIIGYEVNSKGDTNLLLFDPGKSIPDDIRKSAITEFTDSRKRKSNAAADELSAFSIHDVENASTPGNEPGGKDKVEGRKTQEWYEKPVKALSTFRVNLGALSKNTEYQILAFTGGPILTTAERANRKVLRSEAIWK